MYLWNKRSTHLQKLNKTCHGQTTPEAAAPLNVQTYDVQKRTMEDTKMSDRHNEDEAEKHEELQVDLPVVGMLRSFPKVGVEAVLWMVMEEMEEVLSARARGAKGGGLPEIGGLKERDWNPDKRTPVLITVIKTTTLKMMTADDSHTIQTYYFTRSVMGFPGGSFGLEDGRGGGGGGTGLPRD